jgi:hypothetical protein
LQYSTTIQVSPLRLLLGSYFLFYCRPFWLSPENTKENVDVVLYGTLFCC